MLLPVMVRGQASPPVPPLSRGFVLQVGISPPIMNTPRLNVQSAHQERVPPIFLMIQLPRDPGEQMRGQNYKAGEALVLTVCLQVTPAAGCLVVLVAAAAFGRRLRTAALTLGTDS